MDASVPTTSSTVPTRKPKAPQASTSKHRQKVHRRPAPLPARPSSSAHPAGQTAASLPLKTLQGARTKRTDSTKDGWERDVVFVTRNTPLGALMGRCRNLIMHEGYTRIRLHAMAAAIPHAILLLHALLDILPYPQGSNGMWYEIRTGSVECVDEVRPSRKGKGKEKENAADAEGDVQMVPVSADDDLDLAGIGAVEEDKPQIQSRLKSSIQIDLHIGPKKSKALPNNDSEQHKPDPGPPNLKKRNRPSKRKRQLLKTGQAGQSVPADEEEDEEAMMNEMDGSGPSQGKSKKTKPQDRHSGLKVGSAKKASPQSADDDEDEEEEEEEVENR